VIEPPFRTNYWATRAGASGTVSLWGFASSPNHPPYDATSRRLRVAVRQPSPSPPGTQHLKPQPNPRAARLSAGLRTPWLRPLASADGKFESPLCVMFRLPDAAPTPPAAASASRGCRGAGWP